MISHPLKSESVAALPANCCGIRLTEQNLSEIDSGRIMVTVSKQDIQRIVLRHGVQAPHPATQLIAGIVLISLGYFPIRHLAYWFQHGGVYFDYEAWIIALVIAGMFMVRGASKKGYFLDVELSQGHKRLAFQKNPDAKDLDIFVGLIEQCYGLTISREM